MFVLCYADERETDRKRTLAANHEFSQNVGEAKELELFKREVA